MQLIYGFFSIQGASHPRLFLASFQLASKRAVPRYEHACGQCCLFQKFLRNLYPCSSIVQNEVYITIYNHNHQPKIREKDADLFWNMSSCQRDFNRPPFYREFMACIVLDVHDFLPSIMQTYIAMVPSIMQTYIAMDVQFITFAHN